MHFSIMLVKNEVTLHQISVYIFLVFSMVYTRRSSVVCCRVCSCCFHSTAMLQEKTSTKEGFFQSAKQGNISISLRMKVVVFFTSYGLPFLFLKCSMIFKAYLFNCITETGQQLYKSSLQFEKTRARPYIH